MSLMPRDLYALDDQLTGLLRTENFRGKFDVTAFVESLSARQLDIQRQHPEDAFDPKPLIRDFETALQKLNILRAQVNEDIDRHAKDAQLAEMAHENKIRLLNKKFEVCTLSISSTYMWLEADCKGSCGSVSKP